jgi:ubiquinone/menaquinone biosynthesis C-methylase UbiE
MANGLKKAIARWFMHPSGLGGVIAGKIMARKNRDRIDRAVREMSIEAGDQVLEIGYGPGVAIETIMATTPECTLIGLDPSKVMFTQATRRNRELIEAGKVKLQVMSAEHFSGQDGSLDLVFTINTLPFCEDPGGLVSRYSKWLKPGGRFVIVHQVPMQSVAREVLDQREAIFSEWLASAGLTLTKQLRFPAQPNPVFFLQGTLLVK